MHQFKNQVYVNLIRQKKQVSFIWFITVNVSKGVYELFLANLNLNLSCELVSRL